jgi:hypothetical protein
MGSGYLQRFFRENEENDYCIPFILLFACYPEKMTKMILMVYSGDKKL